MCVVAKKIWEEISRILSPDIGRNYESVAKCWLCNKKFGVVNVVTSAVCWALWKLRNDLCFQDVRWVGMKKFWQRLVPKLKCWSVLIPVNQMEAFEGVISSLERVAASPELIVGAPLVMSPGALDDEGRKSPTVGHRLFDPP
jgi:hypothetical protein